MSLPPSGENGSRLRLGNTILFRTANSPRSSPTSKCMNRPLGPRSRQANCRSGEWRNRRLEDYRRLFRLIGLAPGCGSSRLIQADFRSGCQLSKTPVSKSSPVVDQKWAPTSAMARARFSRKRGNAKLAFVGSHPPKLSGPGANGTLAAGRGGANWRGPTAFQRVHVHTCHASITRRRSRCLRSGRLHPVSSGAGPKALSPIRGCSASFRPICAPQIPALWNPRPIRGPEKLNVNPRPASRLPGR